MFLFLSKVLPPFLYPLGLSVVLLAVASVLGNRPGLRRSLCVVCFLLLAAFSSGSMSNLLLSSLENPYPERAAEATAQAEAIVVLGGGTDQSIGRNRLVEAAELFRAGKAPFVLFSGGRLSFFGSSHQPAEAEAARRQLRELGVPEEAIRLETRSRNTHENAVFSRQALPGTTHILLVTSAFHMRRAAAVFEKVGFRVSAVPVDFWSGADDQNPIFRWLPDAESLLQSQFALKEWLGILVYRIRGWA
jgi:uncharacterized SAM-binding protein YcdF (DUF218 family)